MYKKVWWATRVFFAYETSCLFGDLAAIAVAIAKTSWSTCNGASYQELWLHSILFLKLKDSVVFH